MSTLAEHDWDRFVGAAAEQELQVPANQDILKVLFQVWGYSRFVAHQCIKDPAILSGLLHSGDLLIDYSAYEYREKLLAAVKNVKDQDELGIALRSVRNREMVRIAWRDLAGWAGLEETMRDTTALADACLDTALSVLQNWQNKELGVPHDHDGATASSLVVLGMGKLGAHELNFSSDIDLIFAYSSEGETRGKRKRISNDEFFISLGRRLINTLNTATEQGFVYRVDMRLRPFGDSGPLAMSFAAMEDYYQLQGRDWERYAFIKARPVAGDREEGRKLLEMLRPFVYRRYLDFGNFEALREMKEMIAREVERKGLQDNIKLGSGGIREVEFIGQAFQLIRGGREPALQERSILKVLKLLASSGHLPEYVTDDLAEAYTFLRRVENRLQAFADEQTHSLPHDEDDRARLARSMGFSDWERFLHRLDYHRQHVRGHFDQVFNAPQVVEHTSLSVSGAPDLAIIWSGEAGERQAIETLAGLGFSDPTEVLRRLAQLRDGHACRALSVRGRARMDRLLPLLLGAVAKTEIPDTTLTRVLNNIEAIARRTAYLALLVENPMALSQLVKLCAASPWIAGLLTRYPLLFDELLDPRTLYAPLQRQQLESQLKSQLSVIPADDLEEQMNALRHFKQTNVLRVAAADVMNVIPLMEVSNHLSEIAEVVLASVLDLALGHITSRKTIKHTPADGERLREGFAIIAYGKLGGIELGYGSDLDLVFLHSGKTTDDAVFYLRLGQRIIHLLNTPTAAGILYEVDMRLRPSGASGLLVSSVDAFADYQSGDAWTWEHQALVRARVVAGAGKLRQAFDKIRREVLGRARDGEALRREVSEMRAKMRSELCRKRSGYFDIKQGQGGIADIEFIVQYAVLRWAHEHPELLRWTDNIRQLESLSREGLIPERDATLMSDAYRAYRARLHRLALQEEPAMVPEGEFEDYKADIYKIWQQWMISA